MSIIIGLYGSFEWEANQIFDKESSHRSMIHDSGVTLFKNGNHVCSISEERLSKIKNDGNFPINSINYCLNYANILCEEVDYVYIPSMCVDIFYKKWYDNVIHEKIKNIFPNSEIKN